MKGLGNAFAKQVVNNMPAKLQLNEKGQLLNADGSVVPIIVPMPKLERERLIRDCKDELKPLIAQYGEALFQKATEPIKRTVRELEGTMIIMDKRINRRIDDEI